MDPAVSRFIARLDSLSARIAKIEPVVAKHPYRRQLVTLTDLAVGVTEVAVDWGTPMRVATYFVIPQLVAGQATVGNLFAQLKAGTRTKTGCVVLVVNKGVDVVATGLLDVLAIDPS